MLILSISFDSVLLDSIFLEICPIFLGCPICWHIIVSEYCGVISLLSLLFESSLFSL